MEQGEDGRIARDQELDAYLAVTEAAADAIVTMDQQGIIRTANRACERVFGYAGDELVGQSLSVLIPERHREAHAAGMQGYLRTGRRNIPWTGVALTGLSRNGEEIPLEISFGEYRRPEGYVFVGIMRDIRERVRSEAVIRQQSVELEARLTQSRHLLEASPAVIYMLRVVGDDVVPSWVSSNVERVLGYAESTVLVDGWWSENLHPDDAAQALDVWQRVFTTGDVAHEYRFRRAHGGYVWIHDRMRLIPSADGATREVVGSWVDVTERKEAEAHYRRLVENSPYAIYVVDLQGRFTEVNAAGEALLGRSAETLLGMHISELTAPEDLPMMLAARNRVLGGGEPAFDLEAHIIRPSGERRLVHMHSTSIRRDGVVVGTHGIVRDVTDHVRQEKQLRRAERLATVGTLIAGVAHELNNPLHAIHSFAELMLLDEHNEADTESLTLMRREAERAAKIVSDLRLFARQTQEQNSLRADVDLNDVATHVLKVRAYSLDTRNIKVQQNLSAHLPLISANRSEIEQVIMNLLVNAEQAISADCVERCISVRTYASRNDVVLRVEDTGVGIPAEQRDQIFDPFFTTKTPGEGTGLGLSLVYGIVTEHRGQIMVDSRQGRGSTFLVRFPRATGSNADDAVVQAASSETGGLRVLVVDDEPSIRRVLVRYLTRRGHSVDEAADGNEALRLIDASGYDVVVSDLRMPGLDGEALLERLRDRGRGMDKRLIILTGDASTPAVAERLEAAHVPILVKPVGLEEIGRAVENIAQAGAIF